jgi:hypothetical protein
VAFQNAVMLLFSSMVNIVNRFPFLPRSGGHTVITRIRLKSKAILLEIDDGEGLAMRPAGFVSGVNYFFALTTIISPD